MPEPSNDQPREADSARLVALRLKQWVGIGGASFAAIAATALVVAAILSGSPDPAAQRAVPPVPPDVPELSVSPVPQIGSPGVAREQPDLVEDLPPRQRWRLSLVPQARSPGALEEPAVHGVAHPPIPAIPKSSAAAARARAAFVAEAPQLLHGDLDGLRLARRGGSGTLARARAETSAPQTAPEAAASPVAVPTAPAPRAASTPSSPQHPPKTVPAAPPKATPASLPHPSSATLPKGTPAAPPASVRPVSAGPPVEVPAIDHPLLDVGGGSGFPLADVAHGIGELIQALGPPGYVAPPGLLADHAPRLPPVLALPVFELPASAPVSLPPPVSVPPGLLANAKPQQPPGLGWQDAPRRTDHVSPGRAARAVVPEPGTASLIALGLLLLAVRRR
jgi:hypothetical protein